MKICIGNDHAGYPLKNEMKEFLVGLGYAVKDSGCYSEESVDYPDFGKKVAVAVADGEYDRGILICGTGIGMSITANKVTGIRAALCWNRDTVRLAREHNDANILCLGARMIAPARAKRIVQIFLTTQFLGGRHAERIAKIAALESAIDGGE